MTRTKPPLHRHLLTRSDLARLQVPASDVLAWLANGWIEQVGVLPDDASPTGDPVFTVLANRLRQELALRLTGIGKPTVVLTPLRVRSFLMRALLATSAKGAGDGVAAEATATATTAGAAPDLIEHQALAEVLQEVVAEIEADVDEVLRLAAEEAGLETAEAGSAEATPTAAVAPELEHEPEPEPEHEQEQECFDAAELSDALDALEPDEAAAAPPPATEPAAEPAPPPAAITQPEPIMVTETPPPPAVLDDKPAAATAPAPVEPPPPAAPTATEDATPNETAVVAAVAPPPPPPPSPPQPDPDVVAKAMERIDAFLDRLQHSLVEIVQRTTPTAPPAAPAPPPPPPAPVDMTPLVAAVQAGFERSAQAAATTHGAIANVAERVEAMGTRLEHGLGDAVRSALAAELPRRAEAPSPTSIVLARGDRTPFVLLTLAAMVIAWSLVLWWKTGAVRLALGALLGANLLGCCMLAARRSRS